MCGSTSHIDMWAKYWHTCPFRLLQEGSTPSFTLGASRSELHARSLTCLVECTRYKAYRIDTRYNAYAIDTRCMPCNDTYRHVSTRIDTRCMPYDYRRSLMRRIGQYARISRYPDIPISLSYPLGYFLKTGLWRTSVMCGGAWPTYLYAY